MALADGLVLVPALRGVPGVLSIGKMAGGQEGYYLAAVALGAEDYYLGSGEAPGRWSGRLAGRVGVAGRVSGEDLRAVLGGLGPADGLPLSGREPGSGCRVSGFDLTFSAPKSVSLLFGLGGEELSGRVVAAHERAVGEALGYLEGEAVWTRWRSHGRLERSRGEGLVVAGFRHRSSRAGDPQLHTHALVANVTRTVDGRWGALDGRELYRHARTAGFVYQAVLRGELTKEVGVGWGQVRNGVAEVAGFDRAVLAAFSKRRAEIDEALAARGESSPAAARVAALATRRAKDYGVDPVGLRDGWLAEASGLGWDERRVAQLAGRVTLPEVGEGLVGDVTGRLVGPGGLTARQASFDRRDVVRAWCEQLPAGAAVTTGMLGGLADGVAGDGRVVEVGEGRWSTVELLAVEQRLLATAHAARATGAGRVEEAVASRVVAGRGLSGEQEAMVRRVTGSGDGVEVVVGHAGAGKTFALGAAREVWEAAGYRVMGAALAARAAEQLAEGAGISSVTLAGLLGGLDRTVASTGTNGLDARSVVVVDEAGMVDTRTLARVSQHVTGAGGKLVLVGDGAQLPAIGAGGTFGLLAERLGAAELAVNRRQREGWERDALEALRDATTVEDATRVLDCYRAAGRLHTAASRGELVEQMVGDWWEAWSAGEAVVMLAARNDEVAALNRAARDRLEQAGLLSGATVEGLAAREFRAGDRVVCLRNDTRLGVLNGTVATVTAADPEAGSVTVRPGDHGDAVVLDGGYVTRWLDHGYAITVHKAQGATFDRALLLADGNLSRHLAYVALSRGRAENHLYATDPESLVTVERGHVIVDETRPVLEAVAASIAATVDEQPASPNLPPLPAGGGDPTALWEERERLADWVRAEMPVLPTALTLARDRAAELTGLHQDAVSAREAAEERADTAGWVASRTWRRHLADEAVAARQAEQVLAGELAQVNEELDGLEAHQHTQDRWLGDHQDELDRLAALDLLLVAAAPPGLTVDIDGMGL